MQVFATGFDFSLMARSDNYFTGMVRPVVTQVDIAKNPDDEQTNEHDPGGWVDKVHLLSTKTD